MFSKGAIRSRTPTLTTTSNAPSSKNPIDAASPCTNRKLSWNIFCSGSRSSPTISFSRLKSSKDRPAPHPTSSTLSCGPRLTSSHIFLYRRSRALLEFVCEFGVTIIVQLEGCSRDYDNWFCCFERRGNRVRTVMRNDQVCFRDVVLEFLIGLPSIPLRCMRYVLGMPDLTCYEGAARKRACSID